MVLILELEKIKLLTKTNKIMFNIVIIIAIAIFGGIAQAIPIEEVNYVGYGLFALSFVWGFSSTLSCLTYYSQQQKRFETIREQIKVVKLYEDRQKELLVEFKLYLAEKYPKLEEKIFKLITEKQGDVNVIMKYPEIQSSKTLSKLTQNINQLSNDVYGVKIRIEQIAKDIRYYNESKWEFIKVKIPTDVKEHTNFRNFA